MNKFEKMMPYICLLTDHWLLILISAIFMGVVFGCISKFLIKPVYEAKATLYCGHINQEIQSRNFTTEYSKSLEVGMDLMADYREIIASDRVKNQVDLSLIDILQGQLPIPGKKSAEVLERERKQAEREPVRVPGYKRAEKDDLTLEKLHACCRSKKTEGWVLPPYRSRAALTHKTRLLNITVESNSPIIAVLVANVYADVFVKEIRNIVQIENSQVIDYAKVPTRPVKPNCLRNVILGFFLGAVLMYGFFLLMGFIDMTVKSSEEAVELFHLPVIGIIPEWEPEGDDDEKKSAGSLKIVSLGKSKDMLALAECFRAARANLQYDNFGKREGGKIVMITSATPVEGKSICIANFASAMSEAGKRVLLIDLDLRKPTIHKIFDHKEKTGLVNYLVGEKKLDEVMIKHYAELPLDVICCGPVPPNPSNLLVSKNMELLIEQARKDYDFVFIDAPPVSVAADAVTIGGMIDGAIFLVRTFCTRTTHIARAIEALKQAKVNIIGLVLNRFPQETKGHYGYGYKYGYGYRYRYGYGYGYGYKYKQENEKTAESSNAAKQKKA